MRILPLGDDVILGEGASGGFRAPLEERLQSAQLDFEFVGRRTDNSFEMKYPCHEGWSRATISYLREECLEASLEFKPDIVLLYIGAEDLRVLPNAGIAIARLDKLINSIHEVSPSSHLVCSQLISSRDHSLHFRIKAFNTSLGQLTERLASKKIPVSRIKMHARIKDSDINDAGMPNDKGYMEMSSAWFQSIEEIHRRSTEIPNG